MPVTVVLSGFIPTRAGKMSTQRAWLWAAPVHPHSRGENAYGCYTQAYRHGSSPLARGKSGDLLQRLNVGRFIPTRAGKIEAMSWLELRPAVHPHSRGENVSNTERMLTSRGSSPLARGKSIDAEYCYNLTKVHPHSRGENPYATAEEVARQGSSPLARGKWRCISGFLVWYRFIPTRAGKIEPALG